MGGYDVYCAICGALAGKPYWPETAALNEQYNYDRNVLTEEETEWMNDIRIVGENPHSAAIDKTFISGAVTVDEYGFCKVDPGNHSNFPTADVLERVEDEFVFVQVYAWDQDISFMVPLHSVCHTLFEKVVRYQTNSPQEHIDLEIFYRTLKSFAKRRHHKNNDNDGVNSDEREEHNEHESDWDEIISTTSLGGFDYGPISEMQEQYWVTNRGTESYVTDPTKIADLEAYFRHLPVLKLNTPAKDLYINEESESRDVFRVLSTETVLIIWNYLDVCSIGAFRTAARSIARVKMDNVFWKARLRIDMPWLYDIPKPDSAHSKEDVDWAHIYKDLNDASDMNSTVKINGLVNRRRIWTLCENMAKPYLTRKVAEEKDRPQNSPTVLSIAQSTYMPRLTLPLPTNTNAAPILLVTDMSEVVSTAPKLSVYWNHDGGLSSFLVERGTASKTSFGYDVVGITDELCVRNEVEFSVSDWITGIVITSAQEEHSGMKEHSEDAEKEPSRQVVGIEILFATRASAQFGVSKGDKRLMYVSPGQIIVGMIAQWSARGGISKLSLLQCSQEQIRPAASLFENSRIQDIGDGIQTYLWRDELPPLQMQVSNHESGYWASDMKTDLAPMESLIFGNDEDELSNITSVAADIQFGAFEVRYSNGLLKRIGPRPIAMKVLAIDGISGERVIAIYTCTNHITTAIRFVTNRGQQLVIGQPEAGKEQAHPADGSSRLSGMYGHWTERGSPDSNLIAVGIFTSPGVSLEASPYLDSMVDSHNYSWDRDRLPAGWVEYGCIFGQFSAYNRRTRQNDQVPESNAVVGWMDCTKQIDRIMLSFCHITNEGNLPLVGLALHCVDGSREEIGPTEFNSPSDTDGKKGLPWCWCEYALVPIEEFLKPHYMTETWYVGGLHLRSVRIWTGQALVGLQFTAGGDRESPKYGKCEGEPSGVIFFDRGEGRKQTKGLKLFVDSNRRHTTRDDPVIACIQALIA